MPFHIDITHYIDIFASLIYFIVYWYCLILLAELSLLIHIIIVRHFIYCHWLSLLLLIFAYSHTDIIRYLLLIISTHDLLIAITSMRYILRQFSFLILMIAYFIFWYMIDWFDIHYFIFMIIMIHTLLIFIIDSISSHIHYFH